MARKSSSNNSTYFLKLTNFVTAVLATLLMFNHEFDHVQKTILIVTATTTGLITSAVFTIAYQKHERNQFLEFIIGGFAAAWNLALTFMLYDSHSSDLQPFPILFIVATAVSGTLFAYDACRQFSEGF